MYGGYTFLFPLLFFSRVRVQSNSFEEFTNEHKHVQISIHNSIHYQRGRGEGGGYVKHETGNTMSKGKK